MQLKYMHKCFYSWQSWYFGMKLLGKCNLLGPVSSQQKFEATDIEALSVSQLSDRPCYI